MEAFRRILFLIENTDWMRQKVKKIINTNGEEGLELFPQPVTISGYGTQSGSQMEARRMRFLARSKGAGRGFSFPKLIWDEAYALTGEQQEAQLPTLSAMRNAQIWLTSSPPLTSDTAVPMFTLRRNAKPGGDIAVMDYGAEGSLEKLDDIDLDDQALWIRTNPNAPERISVETIARERAALSDRGFARERLCIWPPDLDAGYTVITKEQWATLVDTRSGQPEWDLDHPDFPHPGTPIATLVGMRPPGSLVGRPVISPDVAPRGRGSSRSSLGLAQRRHDGKAHLELIKFGSGTAWMIPDMIALMLAEDASVAIDPGSPAGSLLADLEAAMKDDTAHEVIPEDRLIKMATRDVAQAYGMIYDAATSATPEGRNIAHLGQDELELAVGGAGTRKVGEGEAWDRINAGVDITGLISVTNANWGLSKLGDEAPAGVPLVVWA
jgi:hypothetical protein